MDVVQGHNKAPVISINPNTMETGVYTTKFPPVVLLIAPPQPTPQTKTHVSRGRLDPTLQHASHITKPQFKFKHKPNNHRDYRWHPSLKHKYNAQVPLGHASPDNQDGDTSRVHVIFLFAYIHINGITGRIHTTTK